MVANAKSASSIEFLTSASGAIAITKSDSTVLSPTPRAIYVGGAGDLAVTMIDGTTVTFSGVPAGTTLPIRCSKVMAATTATNILGLI